MGWGSGYAAPTTTPAHSGEGRNPDAKTLSCLSGAWRVRLQTLVPFNLDPGLRRDERVLRA